jgi:hypothetical protein
MSYTVNDEKKDSPKKLEEDPDKKPTEDKVEAADFLQSAMKVQSDITELLDKGSDFYLFYIIYLNGMEIIAQYDIGGSKEG